MIRRQHGFDFNSTANRPLVYAESYSPGGRNRGQVMMSTIALFSCDRFYACDLQVMMSDWLMHWQSFKTMRARERVFRILLRMLLLPVLVVVHVCAPCTKLAKSWSAPMSKFVSHMAGYFVFVSALFVHNYLDFQTSNRGPPNTGVQLYILLFVVGKWISSLKNMWSYGYQVCGSGVTRISFLWWYEFNYGEIVSQIIYLSGCYTCCPVSEVQCMAIWGWRINPLYPYWVRPWYVVRVV